MCTKGIQEAEGSELSVHTHEIEITSLPLSDLCDETLGENYLAQG